ncbi:preprotein translocase subunit SecG [Cysteiniphilum sp. 6C5]|uniref:preprotein translocase subunit SecG n=1 Tax=unclassified Cysteiniphilum TaxID=2610889 RepID=UPI003F873D22
MLALVITVHIIVAILIVGLILLQQGKGASMGASFGSGASQTVFGSRGAAPFMFKFTAFLVAVFFVTSVSLSYIGKQNAKGAETQTSSGVSQADYQKQQAAQQALIDQAKATDTKENKGTATLPVSNLLKAPAATTSNTNDDSKQAVDVKNATTKEKEAVPSTK